MADKEKDILDQVFDLKNTLLEKYNLIKNKDFVQISSAMSDLIFAAWYGGQVDALKSKLEFAEEQFQKHVKTI